MSKYGKYLNINRLINALETFAVKDDIDNFKNYYVMLSNNSVKISLLNIAIKHGSKNCSEYLIEDGIKCHSYIIETCSYKSIHIVYELIKNLKNKFPNLDVNIPTKKSLISRILDTHKIKANTERIEYLVNLIGFFDINDIRDELKKIDSIKLKNNSSIKKIIREITLNDLGIK